MLRKLALLMVLVLVFSAGLVTAIAAGPTFFGGPPEEPAVSSEIKMAAPSGCDRWTELICSLLPTGCSCG